MSNNIKFLSIGVIAVAIIGIGLFFTDGDKPKEDIVTIRLLDSTIPANWEIAEKLTGKDIMEEEGVKLEQIITSASTGGTLSIQALLANNIDFAVSAWPAWINAIAGGAKIKAVITSSSTTSKDNPGNGLVVLENSSIYSVKDLIGKKIAVNVLGASADYEIREYLKKNGLSVDQVQLVVVPNAQIEQMLRTGQVDVAAWTMGGGVEYYMAMDKGGVRELPGTKRYDIRGTTNTMGSGFREDFLKEHPETVKKFIIAYEKSQRLVWEDFQKDSERVRKAYASVATEKGGNPKLAKYYKSTFSPDYAFANDNDIQWWIDIIETEGKLKPGQIKPSDVYTHEFNPFYTEPQKKGGK